MRILLDENLPVDFAAELVGHHVDTVRAMGWTGVSNGKLLRLAAETHDVLITMDKNSEHQQNITDLNIGVLVIHAHSNRLLDLQLLAVEVREVLETLRPGEFAHVGG